MTEEAPIKRRGSVLDKDMANTLGLGSDTLLRSFLEGTGADTLNQWEIDANPKLKKKIDERRAAIDARLKERERTAATPGRRATLLTGPTSERPEHPGTILSRGLNG